MRLRILIVEDEEDIRSILAQQLMPFGALIDFAEDRDGALGRVSNNYYDLVSIDLKIPPHAGSLEKDARHGQAVLAACRSNAPGTPILVLTGSQAEAIVALNLQDFSHQVDVWGDGALRSTAALLRKIDMNQFPGKVKPVAEAIRALSDVELRRCPPELALTLAENRLIRIFARFRGGARCEVQRLGGGLSDAAVYRVTVFDNHGSVIMPAVAKIGAPRLISEEASNYDQYLVALRHEVTPKRIQTLEWGGKDQFAVFYNLVTEYKRTFFAGAIGGGCSPDIMKSVTNLTDRWVAGGHEQKAPVALVRRRLIKDEQAERVIAEFGIEWARDFETRQVSTRAACVHGDLHGANILVNEDAQAACLIDYGDAGPGFAAIDPVTLEFSFLFHPDGLGKAREWPTTAQAKRWWDLDSYLANCPIRSVVEGCRAWAKAVCIGDRDLAVAVYAYALRQLKYPETDKALAVALLDGAREIFDAN